MSELIYTDDKGKDWTEVQLLTRRVENLEKMVIGYHALLADTLPPAYERGLTEMVEDFFNVTYQFNPRMKVPGFDE